MLQHCILIISLSLVLSPYLYTQCPVRIPSLLPRSNEYTTSTAQIHSGHYLSCLKLVSMPYATTHVQPNYHLSFPNVHHFYSPYQISTSSLLPMSSQDIISTAYFHLLYQHSVHSNPPTPNASTIHVLSVHHLCCPCPVRSPHVHLLLITSQSVLSLLPMSGQNTTSPDHVHSVHHLACP